ncbi:hypothetical protein RD792_005718 [Penstemon davidsonii]|uniref:phosphoglycerate mutase (2,3-diphosphoglycerate-dependent) n=1 Tax=Penstemon davidsonii TaxID=160366 RepID=A0ABR0DF89_9LAMI|nr:hypothetical protein RD792_005718 [Penstemon davidsonii]
MAATSFHQVFRSLQSQNHLSYSNFNQGNKNSSFRFISKGFKLDINLLKRGTYCSKRRSFGVIKTSASQTSTAFDPVSAPTNGTTTDSNKKSSEAALVLIRHGESMWNEKNLFTGCVDVPLTEKGVEEAIEAGKRISNIPVDMIYTSALVRAQMTAMLAMIEHRNKKVFKHQSSLQSQNHLSYSNFNQGKENSSFRFISKGFKLDINLLRRGTYYSKRRSFGVIKTLASQTSTAFDQVLAPSNGTTTDSNKKSSNVINNLKIKAKNFDQKLANYIFVYHFEGEAALVLIRHGESMWNEKNIFIGCVDVPLTEKGVEEAIEAGKRISNIPVDMIYTSALIRAQMTAMLAMTEHRRKKVHVILHNESEQAKTWSQIFSEETKKQCIPVITAWQLNDRMYGELQGLNKQEITDRYGTDQVHEWRRSYDIRPPNGESLELCAERAVAYFKEYIEPQLLSGKNVMIAAHGNSLRSIIMYLDELTSQEVISLELSTGIPMLYIFKDGRFTRRGSPVAPTEASVYAYTKSLAQYRQTLDERFQS